MNGAYLILQIYSYFLNGVSFWIDYISESFPGLWQRALQTLSHKDQHQLWTPPRPPCERWLASVMDTASVDVHSPSTGRFKMVHVQVFEIIMNYCPKN